MNCYTKSVSIIIPVYNAAPYIERCVRSVMNQTYPNLEVIIVDDCGTDNSIAIVERMIDSYKGDFDFRILYQERNGGLCAARNAGIAAATGEWIYFIDDDDEIPKNSIQQLVDTVNKYRECDMVMGATKTFFNEEYYDISRYKGTHQPVDRNWLMFNFFKCDKVIAVNVWNKLIRRKFLIDNGLYFKPGVIHDDNQWMFYVLKKVNVFVFHFGETYIHYRNEGSIMVTLSSEKDAKDWTKIMSDFCDNLYPPFSRLQLLRYIEKYFRQEMYRSHGLENLKLHFKFVRECVKVHLWKLGLMILGWNFVYPYKNGGRFQYDLARYVRHLFEEESEKCRKTMLQ